uniref:Uncharacterized protein n=1 Tax=Arundo donax TaxID=35708 RepID=A0A0A9HKA2_ARUDO
MENCCCVVRAARRARSSKDQGGLLPACRSPRARRSLRTAARSCRSPLTAAATR